MTSSWKQDSVLLPLHLCDTKNIQKTFGDVRNTIMQEYKKREIKKFKEYTSEVLECWAIQSQSDITAYALN